MDRNTPRDRGLCFFELDPTLPLLRRVFTEAVGTCFLLVAAVGSSLAVMRHADEEPLVASMLVAVSIAGALVGLIVALGKISGGHFNPLITVSQWLAGQRSALCTVAYVAGQFAGGAAGAWIGGQLVGNASTGPIDAFPAAGLLISEVVASAGLMTVVLGCARSSRWETGPFAVGAWLLAAIIATPSTSYANPALTIAAVFAAGPMGLTLATGLQYVAAQVVGMILAIAMNRFAFATLADGETPGDEASSRQVTP
jgi:glycerol uptake facilitator-like aquaporin